MSTARERELLQMVLDDGPSVPNRERAIKRAAQLKREMDEEDADQARYDEESSHALGVSIGDVQSLTRYPWRSTPDGKGWVRAARVAWPKTFKNDIPRETIFAAVELVGFGAFRDGAWDAGAPIWYPSLPMFARLGSREMCLWTDAPRPGLAHEWYHQTFDNAEDAKAAIDALLIARGWEV